MVNSQELNKTISELETQVKKFKSISEVYSELTTLKSDLVKLKEQSNESADKLKAIIDKLENKLASYEKLLSDISKDNKSFQKDLEQHINSKLDKHKSDIQVEIRNEGTQIQRGLENSLTLNLNNLQAKIAKQYAKQEKQLNTIKILLFVIAGLCLGLGTFIYLK